MTHHQSEPITGTAPRASDGLGVSTDVGARLRREREHRHWSRRDLIRAMEQAGYMPRTSDENMVTSIRRWETAGVIPTREHQRVLAKVYSLPVLTLFGPPPSEPTWAEIDAVEVLERIGRSDVTASTLDDLAQQVDRLCTSYSTDEPMALIADASRWLVEIDKGLNGHPNASQTRRLHDAASWLALLVGCLQNDLGDRGRAERMRSLAAGLGRDAGNPRAVAWASEMIVWFSLTDGELQQAVVASQAGIDTAPDSDVAVQLWGQQAEAWARLGDRYQAMRALDNARQVLDRLPWPENPRNHFRVDAPKFRKSVMRVARILGDADTARLQAEAIIAEGLRPDGTHRQPMRVADARGALAVVAAEAGDVDEAVAQLHRALDVQRVSRPSLQLVVGEALAVLPEVPAVLEITERVRAL